MACGTVRCLIRHRLRRRPPGQSSPSEDREEHRLGQRRLTDDLRTDLAGYLHQSPSRFVRGLNVIETKVSPAGAITFPLDKLLPCERNDAGRITVRALIAGLLMTTTLSTIAAAQTTPHNVILFVADGLRPTSVTQQLAPTMMGMMRRGVRFTNTHSLFPTFTTANASTMATGHLLGDTGDFSNTVYAGAKIPAANNSVTPFLENDAVIGQMNEQFGGNYLNEETILAAARGQGYSTATVGKLGPVHIFDATETTGVTIDVDDSTGTANGIPLSGEVQAALTAAGLPLTAPGRGPNGSSGTATTPGTKTANVFQQQYFASVATEVVLPLFAQRDKPFVMVFWSRDPDGTQHNQGDSLLSLTPGINGPTSRAAVNNADNDLRQLLAALRALGLAETTDVILTADHGFSTISKQSATSNAVKNSYPGVPAGLLPRGFLAIDIATGLGLNMYDPDSSYAQVDPKTGYTANGNAVIGSDLNNPSVVVAANGGSDLIYVRQGDTATLQAIVGLLSAQDYTSGLFVDDSFGAVPGTLPMSAIGLKGTAVTPQPSIAINFASTDTQCLTPTACGIEIADTGLQQGQGMHGNFSRADTLIVGGAVGPDFLSSFTDSAPTSNADIGMTIASILHLDIPAKGKLIGRVLSEAMPGGGSVPAFTRKTLASDPDANGHATTLNYEALGPTLYFNAAGYPGRTLGLRSSGYDQHSLQEPTP